MKSTLPKKQERQKMLYFETVSFVKKIK